MDRPRYQPRSPSTEGAALPWILDHVLMYPGTYQIPLRTMYTLNLSPGSHAQFAPGQQSFSTAFARHASSNASQRPMSPSSTREQSQNSATVSDTAALFRAHMMSQVAQLPSQPSSLPPSFVTSFVRRCFPEKLEEVDFPQALTALDYLKDLESRRKRELGAALRKLGYSNDEDQKEDLKKRYPGVYSWITSVEKRDRVAEALYTQVYIRLRQWTLINEMYLEPFNKANCIAMLNTLFPPFIANVPTSYLNHEVLRNLRMEFFGYIRDVEEKGKHTLDRIITHNKKEEDRTAWPVVRDFVERYLCIANEIIGECIDVTGRESLEDKSRGWQPKSRKVDSGISFGSAERPSTSSSGASNNSRLLNKPLPPSPTSSTPRDSKEDKHGGSCIDTVAKEIRKISSRVDLGGASKTSKFRTRALKRMKSAGFLTERGKKEEVYSDSGFDSAEFMRQRKIWEANNAAKANLGN